MRFSRAASPLFVCTIALTAAPLTAQSASSRITMSAPRPESREPRFAPAAVAGCFEVNYGPWWFAAGWPAGDPSAILPRRIVLDTMPLLYRSRFRALRPAPSVTRIPSRDVRAAWEMIGGDSVGVAWRESEAGIDLRLGIASPDSLHGLAHASAVSPDPFQQPRAVVLATRVPCRADERAPLSVVATVDDSLGARREAQTDADRIRRGMTIMNAQRVHEMVSRFRLVRGHVPEKLEQLMTVQYTRFPNPDSLWLLDGWGRPFVYFVGPRSYELRSVGPDGVVGTQDDVVSKRPTSSLPPLPR
ncbi:MAG: type II secretion system protein GspG [Gemmatimonadaceae bacterium]